MIGVFDSGYGGLTILDNIRHRLPQFDYLYLGDNARNPYGTRSYEVVYHYTLECVEYLFNQGCKLVILACNTASSKALRTIQQHDLQRWGNDYRVLGVIRPTAEIIGTFTNTRHVGIVATQGTVQSQSYLLETAKFFPDITITQQACPMWVPLIESNEFDNEGADYFIEKYLRQLNEQDPLIDTILLGCTHYPIIKSNIERIAHKVWGKEMNVIAQGEIIANSLADYIERHADFNCPNPIGGTCTYLTTENADKFNSNASIFLNGQITATQIHL